jgi:ankyrin repeat protein
VESGALINIQNKFGISPLLIAVSEGNEDMVRLLLDNNADRSLKTDGGKTALDIATARGNENIIKLLK